MNGQPLSVLVIGCGNIAGGFDQDQIESGFPYTHAGAYSSDKRFSLMACVEPDESRRINFIDFWGASIGFSSIDDVLESGLHFDVISICSSTDSHAYYLERVVGLKPRLVFCEKPITKSLIDAEKLIKIYRQNNILLAVNYSRRFDPDILRLQTQIRSGHWGQLRSVIGCYNKGILNNGSHMIDLLHALIGRVKIIKTGRPIRDFFADDPSVPFWLEGPQEIPIHVACGHANDYSIFEIQLIFSKGVLTMEDGGLFWLERHIVDSDTFTGYKVLSKGLRHSGGYPRSMLNAVENIYDAIRKDKPLLSSGESAIEAQKVCEKIMRKALKNE